MKVIQFIHGLSSGGAETLVKNYVTLMADQVESVVVTTDFSAGYPNEKAVLEAGIRIECIPERLGWMPSRKLYARAFRKLMRPILFPLELRKIIREEKPDVIHIHLALLKYLKPIMSTLSGIRLFYTCHNLPKRFFTGARESEGRIARKLIGSYGLRMIALHPEMATEINAMFDISNTVVVRNGINTVRFCNPTVSRFDMRNALGIPQNAYVLGHVGRFNNQKNHDFLVDIFEEMVKLNQNTYLLMVGSGDLQSGIRAKLEVLGLKDKYLILENRGDIPELLHAMDVFVFPSLYEGLSLSLLETQAAGLRCIVSDTVSESTFLTDHIIPVSLEERPSYWCQVILDSSRKNANITGSLDDYDMQQVLKQLIALYKGQV